MSQFEPESSELEEELSQIGNGNFLCNFYFVIPINLLFQRNISQNKVRNR